MVVQHLHPEVEAGAAPRGVPRHRGGGGEAAPLHHQEWGQAPRPLCKSTFSLPASGHAELTVLPKKELRPFSVCLRKCLYARYSQPRLHCIIFKFLCASILLELPVCYFSIVKNGTVTVGDGAASNVRLRVQPKKPWLLAPIPRTVLMRFLVFCAKVLANFLTKILAGE